MWLPGGAILVFLAIYGPAAGHGFVRDDYSWVLHSQLRGWTDLYRILATDIGFYRPAVGLTFALDEWLFGWNSPGYGLTNVLLAVACAWALVSLARAMGLSRGAAAVAGAVWLLHPGFLPVSVLWVSGRTALLMILGSALCAAALLNGRLWRALAWLVVALFSKEEAVLLPVVLLAWLAIMRPPPVRPMTWAVAAGCTEFVYLFARLTSGATTPLDAPAYYRFACEPMVVASNLIWYVVQALWPMLVLIAVVWICLRPGVELSRLTRRRLLSCALWILASVALTMWLPVRSRLYLALPAAGASLAAAAVLAEWWTAGSPRRRRLTLAAAMALVAALLPAHLRGAHEWKTRTEFAAAVLGDLGALTERLPEGSDIVLSDNRNDPRGNLGSVFGTMANDAGLVASGKPFDVWIEPPPPHARDVGLRPPCLECLPVRLKLVDGRLRLEPSQ
jgi:hypothetical protein